MKKTAALFLLSVGINCMTAQDIVPVYEFDIDVQERKNGEKIRISYLMFLFVSIHWVYSFYLKDIWLVSLLNER